MSLIWSKLLLAIIAIRSEIDVSFEGRNDLFVNLEVKAWLLPALFAKLVKLSNFEESI